MQQEGSSFCCIVVFVCSLDLCGMQVAALNAYLQKASPNVLSLSHWDATQAEPKAGLAFCIDQALRSGGKVVLSLHRLSFDYLICGCAVMISCCDSAICPS